MRSLLCKLDDPFVPGHIASSSYCLGKTMIDVVKCTLDMGTFTGDPDRFFTYFSRTKASPLFVPPVFFDRSTFYPSASCWRRIRCSFLTQAAWLLCFVGKCHKPFLATETEMNPQVHVRILLVAVKSQLCRDRSSYMLSMVCSEWRKLEMAAFVRKGELVL